MSSSTSQIIPTVDLSSFASGGSEESRAKAARNLYDACQTLGFANIVGHGVPDSLLRDSFAWSKKLFELPHEQKMKAPHPPTAIPHRGYSAPGVEKVYSKDDLEKDATSKAEGASLRKTQDFKAWQPTRIPLAVESYEVGSENNPLQPNIWLPEDILPGYRKFATDLYWKLDKTAKRVLEAVSLALQLTKEERDELFEFHSGHNNQLRLLHYPPIEAEKARQQVIGRMPAHQDWSSFTFLFQDEVGGLELEDPRKPGTFVAATPMSGACVLNVGDMLQRFTNGIFQSAMHRVTLPPIEQSSSGRGERSSTRARYSIPYFVAPDNETVVKCFPSCVTNARPARYEPVKFADYGEYISKYMYQKGE